MPLLTVSDLLSVSTQADALALELTICVALGLPTTAWQPLSPEMAILGANSQIVSTYSVTVSQIAQGGFASSAAVIPGTGSLVDGQGFTTTWMDLVSFNVYNVTRVPPTFATGNILVTNISAIAYTYTVGQLHFQNPITGATYTNTGSGTITATFADIPIAVQADASWAGSKGTLSAGQKPILLTPLSGVSPQTQVISLVGTDVETNAALLQRDFAKLGSLSPDGAALAYQYVATTIPTPATQASSPFPFNKLPFTVTAPITRVATFLNVVTGTVGVYVANAGGPPSVGDIAQILAAIQMLCTPLSVTSTVAAVGTVPLNLVFTVFIKRSSGLSPAAVIANITNAVASFCASAPIGGFTGAAQNIIPLDLLIDVIMNANPGQTVDLTMTYPPSDLPVGPTSVPIPGSPITIPPSQVIFV